MKIVPLTVLSTLMALLAGCASVPPSEPRIDRSLTSRGQSDRVKYIIIHYTVSDLPRSIKTLTQQDVSAHYLLTDTEQPFFYALVDESRQSNHAGISSWKIYNQLNSASVGIEIVNRGFTDTPEGRVWYPFKQAQIDQLILLLKDIVQRHGIKPENILGHNDIAPQRKQDPGPLFPWKQLADAGLIAWPEPSRVAARLPGYQQQLPDVLWFQLKLAQHGYAVPQTGQFDQATRNVLSVFQSKYRQSLFDGTPDAETAAILDVLTSPLPPGVPGAAVSSTARTPTPPMPTAPVLVRPAPVIPPAPAAGMPVTPSPSVSAPVTAAPPAPGSAPLTLTPSAPASAPMPTLPAAPQPPVEVKPVPATEPVESQ
ncbi:N-acetylmuramoyl-L-alanine amidase [Duganella sp. CF517]|nr:N-acetylmuramoyl-L-alanine amidase [Duganella sp. CF517]